MTRAKKEPPRQTCQVARPTWYNDSTMFKPIKDWTDEELATEHEIVKAKIAFTETRITGALEPEDES